MQGKRDTLLKLGELARDHKGISEYGDGRGARRQVVLAPPNA
jgi:hypothetical protein